MGGRIAAAAADDARAGAYRQRGLAFHELWRPGIVEMSAIHSRRAGVRFGDEDRTGRQLGYRQHRDNRVVARCETDLACIVAIGPAPFGDFIDCGRVIAALETDIVGLRHLSAGRAPTGSAP
jgi:hypothetical protein